MLEQDFTVHISLLMTASIFMVALSNRADHYIFAL